MRFYQNCIKKSVVWLLFFALCISAVFVGISSASCVAYADESGLSVSARSAYVCDYSTGTVIFKNAETERRPIASMVKIMTLLLSFEEIDKGNLSETDDISVSERAASMGGSQVFLDANTTHKASELIKSVVIASANDSCVALAEHISGSMEGFVENMNRKAKELGMTNTHFANCTGLPAPENYSCAADVCTMLRALLSHEKYYEYAGVWLCDYVHPDGRTTTMTNTNKLIRFYRGCDGGKTGFTNEAKFCLAATAKRDNMRIITVVIGEDNSKQRFADVSKLFDYAFANYSNATLVSKDSPLEQQLEITNGKTDFCPIRVRENICAFTKRGETGNYDVRYEVSEKLNAPVKEGDVVGKAVLFCDGQMVSQTDVVALQTIEKANILDSIRRILSRW